MRHRYQRGLSRRRHETVRDRKQSFQCLHELTTASSRLNAENKVIGCLSGCVAKELLKVDSASCCTGKFGTAETCPSSGVLFYE